jgi:hypothetical protein
VHLNSIIFKSLLSKVKSCLLLLFLFVPPFPQISFVSPFVPLFVVKNCLSLHAKYYPKHYKTAFYFPNCRDRLCLPFPKFHSCLHSCLYLWLKTVFCYMLNITPSITKPPFISRIVGIGCVSLSRNFIRVSIRAFICG